MSFIDLLADYQARLIQYPDIVAAMSGSSHQSIKNEGVVYTPSYIARHMVEMVAPTPEMTIMEPAVGHGIFLHELLEYSRRWNLSPEETKNWFIGKVQARDLNEITIMETKAAITVYFERELGLSVDPDELTNIIQCDGLASSEHVDIVIGNPPYVRTKNMEADYLDYLRASFKSCRKGNVDLFYAFIDHCAGFADQVCFIVPNSLLTNVSAKPLRDIISPRLTDVIDFREQKIFEGIGVYTCIFRIGAATDEYRMSNSLTETPTIVIKDGGTTAKVDTGFDVLSGIATLSDAVFTARLIDGRYYTKLGDNLVEVERESLVPFIKVTKQKSQDFSEVAYMIFPYDKATGTVLSEDVFEQLYPKAHAYLSSQRDKLDARDKGKTEKYEAWFAYGRKQGFRLFSGHVVLVPSMVGGTSVPILIDVTSLVGDFGRALFSSGYVIPLTENNATLCDFVMGAGFGGWLAQHGKPFPGGFYGVSAKQLRGIIV